MSFIHKVASSYILATKDLFIRFGDLPEEGHSYDFYRDRPLKGISVYWATKKGDMYFVQGDTVHPTFAILCREFANGDRPAYLVEGEEVGEGPDREPLITNAKVIKELKWGELSDYEGKISRAMYDKRFKELGGLFAKNKDKIAEREYFMAHAKEYDTSLRWTENEVLMDDKLLKEVAHKWYYGEESSASSR